MKRPLVYLANPLGFSELCSGPLQNIIDLLSSECEIYEPFCEAKEYGARIADIENNQSLKISEAKAQLKEINMQIGKKNEHAIRMCDFMIAILDGMPEDTGVAAEIGFAYALGKIIIGLRTDFRYSTDNLGALVNLQVEYFIENSGGKIMRSIQELISFLKMRFKETNPHPEKI